MKVNKESTIHTEDPYDYISLHPKANSIAQRHKKATHHAEVRLQENSRPKTATDLAHTPTDAEFFSQIQIFSKKYLGRAQQCTYCTSGD